MGMGGFGTCQVLMVHGVATSLTPWASQRRLSWCHTSERLSWSTAAWRCWPGSAWWHLTLSAFLVRSFPLRLCQCPLMPTMLSLGLLVSMLKCCSGWALWSCAAPRRSLNGTPWRSLVTTASPVCSPVMRRVRRRCAQPSWRTAAWLWWHSQVQWPRLPSPAIRSHGCFEQVRWLATLPSMGLFVKPGPGLHNQPGHQVAYSKERERKSLTMFACIPTYSRLAMRKDRYLESLKLNRKCMVLHCFTVISYFKLFHSFRACALDLRMFLWFKDHKSDSEAACFSHA